MYTNWEAVYRNNAPTLPMCLSDYLLLCFVCLSCTVFEIACQ